MLRKRERYIAEVFRRLADVNRDFLNQFFLSRGFISVSSRYNYCRVLGELDRFLEGKSWREVRRAELLDFISSLGDSLSTRTVALYKTTLKSFFRWLSNETGQENPASWIRISSREVATRITRDKLLSPEEVEAMVKCADSTRDRALIMTMWETGVRLSEILNMKIKDVEITDSLARISVTGKTGHRVVPVIAALPHLQSWLEMHPLRSNPDAPLWISFRRGRIGEPLRETGIQKILEILAKRAGIRKKVYPHLFRHSRATELAPQLRESVLKQMFGWAQSSRMAATYLHLSGADVENSLRELYGLRPESEGAEEKFRPKKCPRCGALNSYDAVHCSRCSLTLDTVVAIERQKKLEEELEKKMRLFALGAVYQVLCPSQPLDELFTNVARGRGLNRPLTLDEQVVVLEKSVAGLLEIARGGLRQELREAFRGAKR